MGIYKSSIFNDVIGPVMTGPSSSHTAAPARIGFIAGKMLENITRADIIFPQTSSYSATYIGQHSNIAFVAGILGMELTDKNFNNSLKIAENKNISINFIIKNIPLPHPNTAYITVSNNHSSVNITSYSTGGGTIEITEINGTKVSLKGDSHIIVIFNSNGSDSVNDVLTKNLCINHSKLSNKNDINSVYKIYEKPSADFINSLNKKLLQYGSKAVYIPPVQPVAETQENFVPFSTAKEFTEFIKNENMEIWQAAIYYEKCRSGWSENHIWNYMENIIDIMENSIKNGFSTKKESFYQPCAHKLKNSNVADIGILKYAHIYATSVMEYNSFGGIVVASPTAGSCGVLPGFLFSARETKCLSKEKLIKALFCAGIIGIFINEQATFGAEVAACQAENGSASAMAAGAAAYIFGGNNTEILNSASTALQNMLGLICDPVAGCAMIPCISRNSAAISNAVISACLVMGGYNPVIELDQTIQAMLDVGKMLPRELRCTGLGGLCKTPAGIDIYKKYNRGN